MSLEAFGKLPKKDDGGNPETGSQDSAILQNFVDVVAAFEKNFSNMNQQLQMQLQASTPVPTPKQAFAHLQYPPKGSPYPTWDGRIDTDRHPRASRRTPHGSMHHMASSSVGSYGNIWDNFGSLPRRSHSKSAAQSRVDYPMTYNPEALYENSAAFDAHRPVNQEADRFPNMGYSHPSLYPGYQQGYPQTYKYPYGMGSLDYPSLGPAVPATSEKNYNVPVMIPRKGSNPQLDDTSSSPVSSKSRSRSWWPTSNLGCKKRNKSKEDLKFRNGSSHGRSSSPEPFPSRARSSTRLPTASPSLRRANTSACDYNASISMGDMSQMLRDAERQIARLKREQLSMNHHFEGSRRDVMVLQAENDKLKQDYLRLQSELNQLKTTKVQSASVPQLSPQMVPHSPSPSIILPREQSSSRNTINRTPSDRVSSKRSPSEDDVLGARCGTPFSLIGPSTSSREVLNQSLLSCDNFLQSSNNSCKLIQVVLAIPMPSSTLMEDSMSLPLQRSVIAAVNLDDKFEVKSGMTWSELDRGLQTVFEGCLEKIDPKSRLGLSFHSCITSYTLGEINRQPCAMLSNQDNSLGTPALLPYGYCVGECKTVCLNMDSSATNASSLSLQSCIHRSTFDIYVQLLINHRKLAFMGPPGMGKKYLSMILANHVASKFSDQINQSDTGINRNMDGPVIQTLDASEESEISFKIKLQNNFLRRPGEESNPANSTDGIKIGLLYNLQQTSISHTLTTLNSNRCCMDYVIITMETANSDVENYRVYKNFRWINLSHDKDPINGLLKRHLSKRMLFDPIPVDVSEVSRLITWVDRFCTCICRLMSKQTANQKTLRIGPATFLNCPLDPEQLRIWICTLWNEEVLAAIKPNLSEFQLDQQCNEILNWIYRSFPWNLSTNQLSPLASNDSTCDIGDSQNLFGANTSERYSHHEYSELLKNLCSLSLNALQDTDSPKRNSSESANRRPMSSQPITTQHFNFTQPITTPVDDGPDDVVEKIAIPVRPTELPQLTQHTNNASKHTDRNLPTNQGSEHESCSNEDW